MLPETRIAIGQVKQDISELANRVADSRERIILISHGQPKAALVSIEDYKRLQHDHANAPITDWQAWLTESEKLTADILARRKGEPLDVDALWQKARADLGERDGQILGN
jgi:prevent-host-death family protein